VEVPEKPRLIAGRYELESLIGEGGMASVWRARDLTLERAVAVKLLYARDERDKEALVRQFVREARIAASVQHRNVIHIVDFGTTDEQQPYMVMELLEGESLAQRLQSERRLRMEELVHVASLTLRGLEAVHEAGIVHRDLKPDNIYLMQDSGGALFPKILDFGISRSVEPRSGRRSALTTKEGIIVGTPEYMSPEQARGVKTIDRRTDIYSMGVILYEALGGKLPFVSENVGDLIIQIVTGTAPSVRELNPHVPEALADVVSKAMQRDPDQRYQDALSMREALHAALGRGDPTARTEVLSDLPPAPPPAGATDAAVRVSQNRLRTLEFPLLDEQGESMELDLHGDAPDVGIAPHDPDDLDVDMAAYRSRRRWPLLAGAGLVLAVAVGAWAVSSDGGDGAAGPSASAAQPPRTPTTEPKPEAEAEPAPAPEAEPEPTIITVTLEDVPEGARVEIDGTPTEGDVLELPRDGRNRVIKVLADGKAPWQVVHHASANATYEVMLVDAPKPAPRRKARRPQRTTPRPRTKKKPPAVLRKLDF
jgi:serine/threonine-protein kinase